MNSSVSADDITSAYLTQEVELAIPSHWQDKTLNAFVIPSASGRGDVSFVITRHVAEGGVDVETYADQGLAEAARRLQQFCQLSRSVVNLSGHDAVQVEFTWLTPDRVTIFQRQLHVRHGRRFLTFTLSVRNEERAAYDAAWRQIIENVRFRPTESP